MKPTRILLSTLAAAMLAGGQGGGALALEPATAGPSVPAAAPVQAPGSSGSERLQTEPTPGPSVPAIDPVLRGVLLALVAGMLREAADSPDPLATLGESMERKLSLALSSPEAVRALESVLRQALKEVPEDLREPLARFAGSLLSSAQRDLQSRRPRSYY